MLRPRKKRPQEILPSPEQFQDFADAIKSALVIITPEKRILYMNNAAVAAWGAGEGQQCYRVMRGSRKACQDCPADTAVEKCGFVLEEERMRTSEGWQQRENIYIPLRGPYDTPQLVVLMSTSTEEKKRLEDQVEREREQSRSLLNALNIFVMGVGRRGEIDFVNVAGTEISGYSDAEIISGGGLKMLVPGAYRGQADELLDAMTRCESAGPVLIPIMTKTGRERMLSWTCSPLAGSSGTHEGAICLGQDVTDRFRRRREAEDRARDLAIVNTVLSRASASTDVEEMLRVAPKSLLELPGCSGVASYTFYTDAFRKAETWGFREGQVPEEIPGDEEFLLSGPTGRGSMIAADRGSEALPRLRTMMEAAGVTGMVVFPIVLKERPVGMVLLGFSLEEGETTGQFAGILGAAAESLEMGAENIQLRQSAEGRAREAMAQLRIVQGLATTLDSVVALSTVVEEAVELLGADLCAILLYDEDTGVLMPTAGLGSGWDDVAEEGVSPESFGPFSEVRETLGTVTFESPTPGGPAAGDWAGALSLKSGSAVPLVVEGAFAGVLFAGVTSSVRSLSGREVELLESFARYAAVAIRNTGLMNNLAASEERYRTLVDNSMFGVFVHDGTDILFMNDRTAGITGFPKEELKSLKDLLDLLEPGELERITTYMAKRFAGEEAPAVYDTTIRRKDGSKAEIQLMNTLMTLGGRQAIMVTVNDITERVQAEEAVKTSEERYRTLVESSQDGILILSPDGKVVFSNSASRGLTGLSPEELLGRDVYGFVHPDERDKVRSVVARNWREGKGVDRYPVRVSSDDEDKYFEVTTALLGSPGADGRVMMIVRDVTGRVHAENLLRASEERYRTIVEKSRDAIVVSNRAGEILYANPAIEGIFGTATEEAVGRHLFEFVHPDDRERVALDFVSDWKTGQTVPNYPIKAMKKDGSTAHIEATSGLMGWPAEDALQIFVIRDVTERRRREEEAGIRLKMEEILAHVSAELVDPVDLRATILDTLAVTGDFLGVSRAYYFELSDVGDAIRSVVEWTTTGVPSAKDNIRKADPGRFGWWYEELRAGRYIIYDDSGDMPEEVVREFLRARGVLSMASMPVFVRGILEGFISYDYVVEPHGWTGLEVELLHRLADTISRGVERKKWVDELGRSERFRARITENVAEGLLVLTDGTITWANRQACDIYGYEMEEMLGRTTEMFSPGDDYFKDYVVRMLDAFAAEGRLVSEEKAVRKDGAVIDVLIAVAPIGTGGEGEGELVIAVRDITDEKRMRSEVEASAEAYSTIFSTAGDGLLVSTTGGRIIDANEKATEYTGYGRDELIGMNLVDLVIARVRELYSERVREIQRDGITSFETSFLQKDGGRMPVEVTARAMNIWGEPVILSAVRDITERRKAERETMRRARQLAALNELVLASTSSLDLDVAVDSVLQVAIDVTGADAGLVVLDEPPGRGGRRANRWPKPTEPRSGVVEPSEMETVTEYARKNYGSSVISTEGALCCDEELPLRALLEEAGQTEALFVPLKSGNKMMGVLRLCSMTPGAFDEEDMDFFNAAGAEIGVSFENALIYRELSAEHERLSMLYRVAQSISADFDVSKRLEEVATEGARSVGAESALIALVEPEHGEFRWVASYNLDLDLLEGVTLPIDHGIGGKVLRTKRSVVIRGPEEIPGDVVDDPVLETLAVESVAVVPLVAGDRIVGMLGIHNPAGAGAAPFSDDDVRLLEALGRQAGVALENALLYEEMKKHLEALEKAHAELMTLDRMKSDFVSTVSHELRSPLAVIEGFAKTIVEHFDRIDRETERESIEIILKKSIALEGLIENLLDMSRIEEGRLEVSPETVDLLDICRLVVEDQDRIADMHEVVLETDEPRIIVRVDPEKMEVVIGNLVRNAVKFSPEGGIVVVRAGRRGSSATVEVIDRGIGIPAGEQEKVFDRFYQVDSGETRSYQGTGLGLYIARELIRMMGGDVTVDSTPGEGSTFTVSAPLAG